jgi:hypothetical protein
LHFEKSQKLDRNMLSYAVNPINGIATVRVGVVDVIIIGA